MEEELSSQRERSEQGTPGLVSHTKRKVSDWLGRGEFPGPKGCGGDTSEGCDGWGEVEREGSMSPLERELREVEEYLHGTEPDRALPTTPLAGELTLQAEGSDLDHSQSRPKRPRMMGPYDDDDGGGEPMDTVAAASLAESRGVRGDDGGGRILTRAPAGPHISITGTDGTRVYLKMTTSAEEERKVCLCVCVCGCECGCGCMCEFVCVCVVCVLTIILSNSYTIHVLSFQSLFPPEQSLVFITPPASCEVHTTKADGGRRGVCVCVCV